MMNLVATCADLCRQSYDDSAAGFVTVGDLRYGVFDTEHGKILVIRGSENAHNWLRNVRAIPWRTCGGYLAHKGFVRAYQALCSGGMPTCRGAVDIVCGHSLGGAIATLYAEHTGARLISFGRPKVYLRFFPSPDLAELRYTCDDDPVPTLPLLAYAHKNLAITLRDGDCSMFEVRDHYMAHYITALQAAKV